MSIEIPTWLQALLSGLGARFAWALVTLILAGVFAAYIDRRKFAGKWRLNIRWTPEHAKRLLGSDLPEPHSEGDVAITYGHGPDKRDYWGLGYFTLFSGTKRYAHLCIELLDMEVKRKIFTSRFPFFFRLTLTKLVLRSRIRERLAKFDYAPWSDYRMEFGSSSGHVLTGSMVLIATNEKVGTVDARRAI